MTVTTPSVRTRRRRALLPVQVLYAVFLPVWFALAIAATMGLASTAAWWAAPGILLTWLYPVVALVAVAVSHALWTRDARRAHLVNGLALPWLVVGAAVLLWILAAEPGSSA